MSGQFKLDVTFGRALNFELLIITCLFVQGFDRFIASRIESILAEINYHYVTSIFSYVNLISHPP